MSDKRFFLRKLHPELKQTREMLLDGRVWEWNGHTSTADDYVRLYNAHAVDVWIRQEHLLDDIKRAFGRWLPEGIDLQPLLTKRNALRANGPGLQLNFTPLSSIACTTRTLYGPPSKSMCTVTC